MQLWLWVRAGLENVGSGLETIGAFELASVRLPVLKIEWWKLWEEEDAAPFQGKNVQVYQIAGNSLHIQCYTNRRGRVGFFELDLRNTARSDVVRIGRWTNRRMPEEPSAAQTVAVAAAYAPSRRNAASSGSSA